MNLLKSKKFILISSITAAVAVVAAVLIIVLNKEDAYRIVKVFEVDGDANVEREDTGSLDPYANMLLVTGDHVSLDKGTLSLRADEDKYIYLEEQTELVLHATGDAANSKTKIDLLRGAITNEIQNKLVGDSSYEINTPNSTMSVRGTIFYVCVYEVDGVKYTKVVVFSGSVATRLIYKDGTVSDREVLVGKGDEVTIYEDDTVTDYVTDPTPIVFEELPESILRKLQDLIKGGNDVSITDPEIQIILDGLAAGKSPADLIKDLEDAEGASEGEDGTGDDALSEQDPEQIPGDDSQGTEDGAVGEGSDDQSGDTEPQKPTVKKQESSQSTGDQDTGSGDTTDNSGSSDQSSQSGTVTVTFRYNGNTFGTQSVEKGGKATQPSLSPSDTGDWDFNFDTAINADTTIDWK